jgi:hypothetical protein
VTQECSGQEVQFLPPPSPLVPNFALLYSRRSKQQQWPEPSVAPPRSTASTTHSGTPNSIQHSGQRRHFLSKITKKMMKILPTPRANRLHSRISSSATQPLHHRNGARYRWRRGLIENKKMMRALDLIGRLLASTNRVLKNTSNFSLVQQDSLIIKFLRCQRSLDVLPPNNQVLALSVLFGWSSPDEVEQA